MTTPDDQKRFLIVKLIADKPPARPDCFDTQDDWTRWLVAAHEAGEKVLQVVRRSDTGRTRGRRETHFEVLPTEQIDICRDCTEYRRNRMLAAGRCFPPIATGLLKALKAGATLNALGKLLDTRPMDPPLLMSFYQSVQADMRRSQQAAAAGRKNYRAREHVRAAWAHHLEQVALGKAEAMSKATFAAVMVAAMSRDARWRDARGLPFQVKPRWIAEQWLTSPVAGNPAGLPATSTPNPPAEPAPTGVTA